MRFEKVVWTLLALFVVGFAGSGTDAVVPGADSGARFEAADGTKTIPPPVMDPGSTPSAPAEFTE